MLKRISKLKHPTEIEITRHFSTEPIASHPRNHSVPLYDVLDVPGDDDGVILVLPLLRPYDNPPMESVGEAVEFFRQLFEVRSLLLPHVSILILSSGSAIHPPVPYCPQVRVILEAHLAWEGDFWIYPETV